MNLPPMEHLLEAIHRLKQNSGSVPQHAISKQLEHVRAAIGNRTPAAELLEAFNSAMASHGSNYQPLKVAGLVEQLQHAGKSRGTATPDNKQIDMGKEVEQEHVSGNQLANKEKQDAAAEISKDHLKEDPKYYTHLKAMEDKYKKKAEQEGKGELTPDQESKIIAYVKSHANLDDSAFHSYVESLGIDPHEAEEVVYRFVQTKQAYSKGFNDKCAEFNITPDELIKYAITPRTSNTLSGAFDGASLGATIGGLTPIPFGTAIGAAAGGLIGGAAKYIKSRKGIPNLPIGR